MYSSTIAICTKQRKQQQQQQLLLPGASPVKVASPGVTNGVTLHIVWPTSTEVQHSREGWAAGGSIPARLKNVEKPFLQQHWCR